MMCPDIVKLTECQPATKPEPVVGQEKATVAGGSGSGGHDDDAANPLIANWKVSHSLGLPSH